MKKQFLLFIIVCFYLPLYSQSVCVNIVKTGTASFSFSLKDLSGSPVVSDYTINIFVQQISSGGSNLGLPIEIQTAASGLTSISDNIPMTSTTISPLEMGVASFSFSIGTGVDDNDVNIVDNPAPPTTYRGINASICGSSNFALPVELISFQAQTQNKTTLLTWLTASEKNSSHFEIERSSDAKVFDKIGVLKANGNTYSKQNYEFLDEKPFQGINYYRLKMVDLDATYEYSKIVSVFMDKKGKDKIFTMAPNPARGNVSFSISNSEASEAVLDVRDIAGREIYHKKLVKADNIQNIDWNTEGVSKGIYFVTLTADGERITKKLILN